MIDLANETEVTANGEYRLFHVDPGKRVRVEWSISAGTATVTPGYVDIHGRFAAVKLLDGTAPAFPATGGVIDIGIPAGGRAAVKVDDASVTDAEAEPPTVALSMKIAQTIIRS